MVLEVNFYCCGENVTQFVRQYVIEGYYQQGLNLLLECGLQLESAIGILQGTHCLTGISLNNSFKLELDETSQAYQSFILKLYAGIIQFDSNWFQLYAQIPNSGNHSKEEILKYATNPTTDQAFFSFQYHSWFLFQPAFSPPPWISTWSQVLLFPIEIGISLSIEECRLAEKKISYWNNLFCEPPTSSVFFHHSNHKNQIDLIKLYEIQQKIRNETSDWLFLDVDCQVKVSRPAFYHWALSLNNPDQPYQALSPSGIRTPGDSSAHTDWLLSSGISVRELVFQEGFYFYKLMDLGYTKKFELEQQELGFQCSVLTGTGSYEGLCCSLKTIFTPKFKKLKKSLFGKISGIILLIPTASPEYLDQILDLRKQNLIAVITEQGGALSHLISELTCEAIPVLRMADALCLFELKIVRINLDLGQIKILEDS